jgi:geranylgeranyl diphosphate synthase type II
MRSHDLPFDDALVLRLLDDYGQRTRTVVERYLAQAEGAPYLHVLIEDYPKRGGKMMRSSLCLATARAFGGDLDDALNSAASIELLHNALLIHDDIEDESDERRGRPTLHRLHGIPLAMNAGDLLSLLSFRPLRDSARWLGSGVVGRLIEETERVGWESAEGQALELGWRRDNRLDISDDDYLGMVMKKTCWLATIHPCRSGAIIATAGDLDADAFVAFGFFFGAAFQIHDDLLNLEGRADLHGKEANGDLWEGKRTLMLRHVHAAESDAGRERIARLLATSRDAKPTDEVAWLRERIDHHGSLDHARAIAHGLAGAAQTEFDQVLRGMPRGDDARFIDALVTWVLRRTR